MNRYLAITSAALIALAVASFATVAVGNLILMSMMMVITPQSTLAPYLLAGAGLALFATIFVAVFREMLERFTR